MGNYLAVITPVYATPENGRTRYFRDTAASVLGQDTDFLWLIVNDGSTDRELADVLHSLKDSRVKVIDRMRKPGDIKTASNALNHGFDYALSQHPTHFSYVHSDDLLTKDSLEKRLAAIDGQDMVFGRMAFFDKEGVYHVQASVSYGSADSQYGNFPHHTSMWTRNMIQQLLARRKELFDPHVSFGEDLDLTLSSMNLVNQAGYKLGFLDYIVYIHVNSPNNITAMTPSESAKEQIDYVYDKNGYSPKKPSSVTLRKLFRNPGFFLPEDIKRIFRPYTPSISRLTGGFLFPEANDKEKVTTIDPFWFKHAETSPN